MTEGSINRRTKILLLSDPSPGRIMGRWPRDALSCIRNCAPIHRRADSKGSTVCDLLGLRYGSIPFCSKLQIPTTASPRTRLNAPYFVPHIHQPGPCSFLLGQFGQHCSQGRGVSITPSQYQTSQPHPWADHRLSVWTSKPTKTDCARRRSFLAQHGLEGTPYLHLRDVKE